MTIQTTGASATATPKTIGDLYRANSPQSYPLPPEELALITAHARKTSSHHHRAVLRNFAMFCLATLSIALAWDTKWVLLSLISMLVFLIKTNFSYPGGHINNRNKLDYYDQEIRHTDYRSHEEIQKYRAILDATDGARIGLPVFRYVVLWLFICIPATIILIKHIHY
jgi:hypothetical protein